MNDRIKLAEAMGWEPTSIYTSASGHRDVTRWRTPSGVMGQTISDLPDPETDANDDYAVLKHMKAKCGIGSDCPDWQMWDSFAEEVPTAVEDREIGDYARACLKVLEDSE